MASVYCSACGATLSESAKFCRACGSPQAAPLAPPPPPPPAPAMAAAGPGATAFPASSPQGRSTTSPAPIAALLAIAGGLGMCFFALYTTTYLPLHYEYPLNYGEGPQFADLLALGSGMAAVAIGALALQGRLSNRTAAGIGLAVAGLPTFFLAVLWTFPTTFNLDYYSAPFYYGHVFFSDFAYVELGSRYVPLGLLAACAAVAVAGLLMATGRPEPAPQPRTGGG